MRPETVVSLPAQGTSSKIPKSSVILLAVLLLLSNGCTEQGTPLKEVMFTYEGTGLTIRPPKAWLLSKLPGATHQTIHTDIDYGIIPNIQLVKYSGIADPAEIIKEHLEKMADTYGDYRILSRKHLLTADAEHSPVKKITAKRSNRDNIPIIHLSYLLHSASQSYIISATCAEPSLETFEAVFDTVILSAKISQPD